MPEIEKRGLGKGAEYLQGGHSKPLRTEREGAYGQSGK